MQHNTQVPVGKHDNRQHASPHNEVATDVKQMPIRPIIVVIIIIVIVIIIIIIIIYIMIIYYNYYYYWVMCHSASMSYSETCLQRPPL